TIRAHDGQKWQYRAGPYCVVRYPGVDPTDRVCRTELRGGPTGSGTMRFVTEQTSIDIHSGGIVPDEPSPLLLLEGAWLFHVGVMKTVTTALQRALAAQRELLLDNGVRYPGTDVNHRLPVGAFMRARVLKHARQGAVGQAHKKKADDPSIPPMSEWTNLINEI